MADKAQEPSKPNEEIPAVRISPKKVDDSWKEEMRRERETAGASGGPAILGGASGGGKAPAAKAGAAPREASKGADSPRPAAPTADQQQARVFMTFLAGLAQQALMQLGEIESPFTGQREVDLQGARYTIELLSTIQVKTKGNLSREESDSLTEALRDLKMRYIEIANEVQRQMAAQVQKSVKEGGARRPGPGGSIPGPGSGKG